MTTTTCPDWCTGLHPKLEPGTHQTETWQAQGLTAGMDQLADGQQNITIERGSEVLSLSPSEALLLTSALMDLVEKSLSSREVQG